MKKLCTVFDNVIFTFVLTLVSQLIFISIYAQGGAAINTSGIAADPSAMLDVSSSNKGVLIPRVSEAEKLSITSPARGLMVYQIVNNEGFWYYDGSAWLQFGDNLGNHTASDSLNMTNNKVVNLATCTQNLDAANKEYVDNAVAAGGGGSSMPSMISNESATAYTYSEAVQYCDNLVESNYNDWRMPSRDEILYFTGISGASTNFLWTKTTTKPQMYPDNQNFETVRLTDGKWRNGIETSKPLVGVGINSNTSNTTWTSFGTITPSTPGNILNITHIQLLGHLNRLGSLTNCYYRIKYYYADGNTYTSPEFVSYSSPATVLFEWENKENPVALTSIELEAKSSYSSYAAYGTLTVSGYESAPDQKDGNTLNVRCVR